MDSYQDHQKVEIVEYKTFVEKQDENIDAKETKEKDFVEIHDGSVDATQTEKKPTRRPDIDLIRVTLTWGILLFHTTKAYIPADDWFLTSKYPLGSVLGPFANMFLESMQIWNMPMFFFLSGISAYFALFKRTEQQFRDERVHRLFVPYLLMFLLQFVYSITYFGPDCREFFFRNETYEMKIGSRLDNCPIQGSVQNITFHEHVRNQHLSPFPGQAWFLLPLFLFSQLLTHLFVLWHPAHSSSTASGLPCCGRNVCCTRPFPAGVKILSCITCFGKPASTSEELSSSTMWWLGSCVKLGALPGLVLGLVDAVLWAIFNSDKLYFTPSPTYGFIMIFGYVITAADDHGIKDILHRGRWIYFVSGILLNIPCSLILARIIVIPITPLYLFILGFFRGFGKWLLILGWYCVTRSFMTSSYPWLNQLSAMAMPFYLIHQQILIAILSGTLWIPYLGSFPVTLVLVTLVTGLLAFLITKMTNVRYFFGLKPTNDSFLPGKKIRGFIPVIVLAVLVFVSFLLAYLITNPFAAYLIFVQHFM